MGATHGSMLHGCGGFQVEIICGFSANPIIQDYICDKNVFHDHHFQLDLSLTKVLSTQI